MRHRVRSRRSPVVETELAKGAEATLSKRSCGLCTVSPGSRANHGCRFQPDAGVVNPTTWAGVGSLLKLFMRDVTTPAPSASTRPNRRHPLRSSSRCDAKHAASARSQRVDCLNGSAAAHVALPATAKWRPDGVAAPRALAPLLTGMESSSSLLRL